MKKSNKGFTLIELLAVIVVLAVIALIATPIVLKLVDQARVGAAESSATAYVKAVENRVLATLVEDTGAVFCSEYTVAGKALTGVTDKCTGATETAKSLTVDVKGDLPTTGTVTITDGEVTAATLTISGYTINYTPASGSERS